MRRLIFFLCLSLPASLVAQVLNSPTCGETDVMNTLNSATAASTTVVLPLCASGVAWTSQGTYTVPAGVTNLTIQGQTTCSGTGDPAFNNLSCTDGTVLQDSVAGGSGPNMLNITVPTGVFLRITGITFQAGTRSISDHGSLYAVCTDDTTGNGQFRFDHNHTSGVSTFMTTQDCFGVLDHNDFSQGAGNGNYLHVWHNNYNQGASSGEGDGSWAANTDFGTMKFMFIEQNLLDNGTDDCTFGGRVVARFNTMINGSSVQTHPTGGGGPDERGCRGYEVYQNNMSAPSPSSPAFNGFFMSSGTAMIWYNTTLNYTNLGTIHSMRRDNSTYPQTATPAGWGYCGTSFCTANPGNSGCPQGANSFDQNSVTTTGYACIDQPGRGKGDLIVGVAPAWTNQTSGIISWVHQALDPVYEWNDTKSCAGCGGNFMGNSNSDVLTQNVDYYLGCGSNQGLQNSGCLTFTGATGVGWGTRASRPSTCTQGVAYFSTDQGSWNVSGNGAGSGVLDECTATNTWTPAAYTPFTYPHPLEGAVVVSTGAVIKAGHKITSGSKRQ